MTDQAYKDMSSDTGVFKPANFPKVPPVEMSVFDEALPMLWASRSAYSFTDLLDWRRETLENGGQELTIPEEFAVKELERFVTESMDLTGEEFNNGGNGLSFAQINALIEANEELLIEKWDTKREDGAYDRGVIRRMREAFDAAGPEAAQNVYLTHHRSIRQNHAAVYTIVKDANLKKITVAFRGSQTRNDWVVNFQVVTEGMRTPGLVKPHLKGKPEHEEVFVHNGFYDFLFDNQKLDGNQRYDQIKKDIEAIIEDGYSITVTGHSLGGALAQLLAFKLAGRDNAKFPRPITCITWAAPHVGAPAYRVATEHLERDGLLRCLRINVGEDVVPALAGFSIFRPRRMKHVGINLRLHSEGFSLEHSSKANFMTFLRNTIFKPLWGLLTWHSLRLHDERFVDNEGQLQGMKLDDLYKDPTIVSEDFLQGRI